MEPLFHSLLLLINEVHHRDLGLGSRHLKEHLVSYQTSLKATDFLYAYGGQDVLSNPKVFLINLKLTVFQKNFKLFDFMCVVLFSCMAAYYVHV